MRFNGNILGVDNRASVGNTRGLWTLPPQAQARRRGAWSVYDQDAATYIAAVEAADQQPLELQIKDAIHTFVAGCKTDGIWSDIQACAILCGARTLTGALKALVGTDPTNNNFVSGDYDRALGLKGDKSTKYIDTNRNNNADGQDDQHLVCYVSVPDTISGSAGYMGTAGTSTGATHFNTLGARNRNSSFLTITLAGSFSGAFEKKIGLHGMSRDNSSTYLAIGGDNTTTQITQASQTPSNENILVFRRFTEYTNARMAFYSVGAATDLVLLEKNVTRLVGAIQGHLL
jgi:hypothetical protein